jgi:hypothetical protein
MLKGYQVFYRNDEGYWSVPGPIFADSEAAEVIALEARSFGAEPGATVKAVDLAYETAEEYKLSSLNRVLLKAKSSLTEAEWQFLKERLGR